MITLPLLLFIFAKWNITVKRCIDPLKSGNLHEKCISFSNYAIQIIHGHRFPYMLYLAHKDGLYLQFQILMVWFCVPCPLYYSDWFWFGSSQTAVFHQHESPWNLGVVWSHSSLVIDFSAYFPQPSLLQSLLRFLSEIRGRNEFTLANNHQFSTSFHSDFQTVYTENMQKCTWRTKLLSLTFILTHCVCVRVCVCICVYVTFIWTK